MNPDEFTEEDEKRDESACCQRGSGMLRCSNCNRACDDSDFKPGSQTCPKCRRDLAAVARAKDKQAWRTWHKLQRKKKKAGYHGAQQGRRSRPRENRLVHAGPAAVQRGDRSGLPGAVQPRGKGR